jgi:hypothetical protein
MVVSQGNIVMNQGVKAVSDWDYNKSYNEVKVSVEKLGKFYSTFSLLSSIPLLS